jgi:hypothetical protein
LSFEEKQNLQHFFEYSKLIIFGMITFMLGWNSFIRTPLNSSNSELFYKKTEAQILVKLPLLKALYRAKVKIVVF